MYVFIELLFCQERPHSDTFMSSKHDELDKNIKLLCNSLETVNTMLSMNNQSVRITFISSGCRYHSVII